MEQIAVAAAVAELVGAEDLRLLEVHAQTGYTCVVCQQEGQSLAEEPASVVLLRDEFMTVARLAHVRCSASRVVDLPPGSLRAAEEAPASAVSWVVPSASELGVRPLIVVEMSAAISVVDGPERVDALISGMLRQGLHLIARIGRTAPPAEGWAVTLTGSDTVRIDGPGTLVYDGTLWRPPAWEQAVVALGGACEVLVGVGLQLAQAPGSVGEGLQRLRDVSRAGLLAGGLVPVHGAA